MSPNYCITAGLKLCFFTYFPFYSFLSHNVNLVSQLSFFCKTHVSAGTASVIILFYCHRFVQADATLEMEQRDFARAALEYVCLIQVKPGMLFKFWSRIFLF
jgi:hypothetical protein